MQGVAQCLQFTDVAKGFYPANDMAGVVNQCRRRDADRDAFSLNIDKIAALILDRAAFGQGFSDWTSALAKRGMQDVRTNLSQGILTRDTGDFFG